MAKIHIEKPHTMSVDVVKRRVEEMMDKIKSMGVDCEWQMDQLNVSGRGVKGQMDVTPDRVVVDLNLGMPASMMKGKIEEMIRNGLDKQLQSPQENG
jgi:putative polyhydroxyalkanoate system protein